MNRLIKQLLLLLSIGSLVPVHARVIADRTLATIYHPEGTILICQTDLRADLSERVPTLRDAVVKELIILDGKKLKIPVTDEEVDRSLARVQEHLKMTRDELLAFFKKQGYSLAEAKKELEKTIMVENVMEARIKTKAHVSQKALEQYHNDNPHIMYGLEQAFIPFKGGSKAIVRAVVKREIASGEIATSVNWTDIGEVNHMNFSPEKAFIRELPEGSVAISSETDQGITLLKLAHKNVATFEDRKNEIAGMLGQKRFMEAQKTYFDKLMQEANIRYNEGVQS